MNMRNLFGIQEPIRPDRRTMLKQAAAGFGYLAFAGLCAEANPPSVEQGPLAPLLAIAFGQRMLPQDLIELLREHAREPAQLGRGLGAAAVEQQPERLVAEADRSERQDVEPGVLERRRRPAPPVRGAMRRRIIRLTPGVERVDQRVVPVLERHDE